MALRRGPVVARGQAEINVDVDRKSVANAHRKLSHYVNEGAFRGLAESGRKLFKAIYPEYLAGGKPVMAALGAQYGGTIVVSMGSALASGAAKLARGFGASVALLPAAATAAAASVAALKVGFKGVGDALSAGLADDTDEYREALDRLHPAARNVVDDVVAMRGEFGNVRQVVQGNLFEPLQGKLGELLHNYLAPVRDMLGQIADGFGRAFAKSADILNTRENVSRLGDAFDRIGAAVGDLASRAIPNLVAAFVPLIDVGSLYMPRLADAISDASGRFRDWMNEVSESGQLQDFIDRGIQGLVDIWDWGGRVIGVFADIGATFQNVADAIGLDSAPLLDRFEDLAEKAREWTGSLEGQAKIKDIFNEISTLVDRITRPLFRLWDEVIKPALPDIKAFFDEFGRFRDVVTDALIEQLNFLAENVLPLIVDVLKWINDHPTVAKILGDIAAAFILLSVAGSAIGTVMGAFSGLQTFFAVLAPLAVALSTPLWVIVAPIIALVGWIAILNEIWGEWYSFLVPFVSIVGLAAFIIVGFAKSFDTLKQWVSNAWNFLRDNVFNPIKNWITGTLIPRFQDLWSVIVTVWNGIRDAVSRAWTWIRDNVWTPIRNWITGTLVPKFQELWDKVRNVWQRISDKITSAWYWIRDHIWNPIRNFITEKLMPSFSDLWSHISAIWSGIRDTTSRIWRSIVDKVRGPVNTIIGIWNTLADAANDVLDAIGLGRPIPELPKIPSPGSGRSNPTHPDATTRWNPGMGGMPRAAEGMRIGGGFMTDGPMVIVGEGRQQYPEFVIPTDPQYRGRALALTADLISHLGLPGMAVGGIIGDALSAGKKWVSDRIGQVAGFFRGALTAPFAIANRTAKAALDRVPNRFYVRDFMQKLREVLYDWVRGGDSALPEKPPPSSGGGTPGGPFRGTFGVERWRGVALQALRAAGQDPAWVDDLLRQMQRESGGNPFAINLWDINARRGMASRGLMQVIPPTFNAYAGPYRSRGIYDPFANIYAAIRYTVSRYGTLGAWRRRGFAGYADGAYNLPSDQLAIVHKGEMILPSKVAAAVRAELEGRGRHDTRGPLVVIENIHVTGGATRADGEAVAHGFMDVIEERRVMTDARLTRGFK